MLGVSTRKWLLRSDARPDFDQVRDRLCQETGLSRVTVQILLNRGIETKSEIENFLEPSLSRLTHPFEIKDCEKAVDRLSQARAAGEKVMVFGDYDVDGTCGAALLSRVFTEFGIGHSVRQPDRFKEGYGLSVTAVEEAKADGVSVIVSIDCGISSFDAGDSIQKNGLDWIIVDHHQLDSERGIPNAIAVVNPQRPDCESGLRELCGCALGFYLAMGLRIRAREEKWFGESAVPNLKKHLDLVVLATAADQVPLLGNNRILVKHGMDVLMNSEKPGFKALIVKTGMDLRARISPGSLGFVLGPRINASGRMGSANTALRLLVTEDESEASRLVEELEEINKNRMETQNQIWDEIRKRVKTEIEDGLHINSVVVFDPGWHEGVVGIVASRITESFHKPAVVISVREDIAKGSVRSYGGKNVLEALHACSALLAGYGGHKFAAGLSLAPESLIEFRSSFDQAVGLLGDPVVEPLMLEGEFGFDDFDLRTLREIEAMAPYGPGHPEPVFQIKASPRTRQILKGRHLKFFLESFNDDGPAGRINNVEAIWFNGAESADVLQLTEPPSYQSEVPKSEIYWAGIPEINRFRGQAKPSFRIKDLANLTEI